MPWFLVIVFLVAGFTIFQFVQHYRPAKRATGEARSTSSETPSETTVPGWAGTAELSDGRLLRAELTPYHLDHEYQSHRSARLRARLGLGEGELWRMRLFLETESDERIAVGSVRIRDEHGLTMMSVDKASKGVSRVDPLLTLLADSEVVLTKDEPTYAVLWGRRPEERIRCVVVAADTNLALELAPAQISIGEWPRWFRGRQTAASAADSAAGEELAQLRAELERERTRRQERELEFLEFTRTLATLDLGEAGKGLTFGDEDDSEAGEPEATGEADDGAEPLDESRRRAEEIRLALHTLFRLEGLRGMEILEAGRLGDGWVGPVVFRILDDRGSLAGSVFAQRLRLEASRAARTLTVVLEEGYESRGGERVPFANEVRHVVLPYVDPEPWFDSVPELFTAETLSPLNDDGVWNLTSLQRELNRLLGLEAAAGWYRIRGLGGVLGDELAEVFLDEFDESGRIRRRLFADRLTLHLEDEGVMLLLEGGAIVRGGEKKAFRGGVHRIYLPRAPRSEWERAALPGLNAPLVEGEAEVGDSENEEGQGG